jgi:NAD+ synthase
MTAPSLRIALAQANPTIGDIAGNAALIRAARRQATDAGAELVAFPEFFLCGWPPEDLALAPALQDACRKACEELARETGDGGPALLVGLPWVEDGKLCNGVALLDAGLIQSVRFKVALERGSGLDEERVFTPGPLPGPIVFRDRIRLGVPLGGDLRDEEVVECLTETGAELLLALAASPFRRGGGDARLSTAVARIVEAGLPLVWLNQTGGQGELVFDGASFVLAADRSLTHQLPAFRDALVVTDWRREAGRWRALPGEVAAIETGDEADYAACVLGLRDFAAKSGLGRVLPQDLGDASSALAAAMALDAVGSETVVREPLAEAGAGDPGVLTIVGIDASRLALGEGARLGDFNPLKDISATQALRLLALRRRWRPAGAFGPETSEGLHGFPPADSRQDAIIAALADPRLRLTDIVARGHEREAVLRIAELCARADGARRRAAPGPLLSAADMPSRFPLLHRFEDTGTEAHEPDSGLVKGVGKAGGESFDF